MILNRLISLPLTPKHLKAMALALMLLLIMALSIGLTISDYVEKRSELMASQEALHQFEIRLSEGHGKPSLVNIKSEDYIIPVSSASIAAADLQKNIDTILSASGGSVQSTEVIPNDDATPTNQIELSISFTIDEPALQPALYAIESSRPAMVIENLALRQITQVDAGETPQKLQGSLTVRSLWKATNP